MTTPHSVPGKQQPQAHSPPAGESAVSETLTELGDATLSVAGADPPKQEIRLMLLAAITPAFSAAAGQADLWFQHVFVHTFQCGCLATVEFRSVQPQWGRKWLVHVACGASVAVDYPECIPHIVKIADRPGRARVLSLPGRHDQCLLLLPGRLLRGLSAHCSAESRRRSLHPQVLGVLDLSRIGQVSACPPERIRATCGLVQDRNIEDLHWKNRAAQIRGQGRCEGSIDTCCRFS